MFNIKQATRLIREEEKNTERKFEKKRRKKTWILRECNECHKYVILKVMHKIYMFQLWKLWLSVPPWYFSSSGCSDGTPIWCLLPSQNYSYYLVILIVFYSVRYLIWLFSIFFLSKAATLLKNKERASQKRNIQQKEM